MSIPRVKYLFTTLVVVLVAISFLPVHYESESRELVLTTSYAQTQTVGGFTLTPAQGKAYDELQKQSGKCNILSPLKCVYVFTAWLITFIIQLLGKFLNLVQWIFSYVLQLSILDFKSLANVVNEGWKILRDVANVFFIFILLWIAIQTVLGVASNTTKLIVNVILAALLINFSGVIARVVIDTGNVLTMMFWQMAKGSNDSIGTRVINGTMMVKATGLASAPSSAPCNPGVTCPQPTEPLSTKGAPMTFWNYVLQAIGAIVVMTIVCILFITMAVLFFRRLLWLIFLILVAPFAFLIFAFQGFTGGAKKWWDHLICQTFFAPVFMIMFAVSLKVIEAAGPAILGSGGTWAQQFVFIIISCTLLFESLSAANSLGCTEGTAISKWAGNKLHSLGVGAATSIGRNTLGRGGAAIANTQTLRKWAAGSGVGGASARLAFRGASATAGATFGGKSTFIKDQEERFKGRTELAEKLTKGVSKGAAKAQVGTGVWDIATKKEIKKDAGLAYGEQLAAEAENRSILRTGTGRAVDLAAADEIRKEGVKKKFEEDAKTKRDQRNDVSASLTELRRQKKERLDLNKDADTSDLDEKIKPLQADFESLDKDVKEMGQKMRETIEQIDNETKARKRGMSAFTQRVVNTPKAIVEGAGVLAVGAAGSVAGPVGIGAGSLAGKAMAGKGYDAMTERIKLAMLRSKRRSREAAAAGGSAPSAPAGATAPATPVTPAVPSFVASEYTRTQRSIADRQSELSHIQAEISRLNQTSRGGTGSTVSPAAEKEIQRLREESGKLVSDIAKMRQNLASASTAPAAPKPEPRKAETSTQREAPTSTANSTVNESASRTLERAKAEGDKQRNAERGIIT